MLIWILNDLKCKNLRMQKLFNPLKDYFIFSIYKKWRMEEKIMITNPTSK